MQTDTTLLDVTCCARLHSLLHVVWCCCVLLRKVWNRSNFPATTANISLVPWSPKRSATMLDPFAQLFQHCLGHARSLRMVYKDLWVVSFPRCTAGSNIVWSCFIRLHNTANTDATILGVVASVCTQPKSSTSLNFSFKLSTFYLASILFMWLKLTCVNVRNQKRVSGNQPLRTHKISIFATHFYSNKEPQGDMAGPESLLGSAKTTDCRNNDWEEITRNVKSFHL